jgi:polysaccharide deacetylase 2 family uncharacterized protein YibQ
LGIYVKTADNDKAGMKKIYKILKKPNPRKKRTGAAKKPAKRKKAIFSDALRAFLLAGVITIFAAAISLAIITAHSRLKNTPPAITESEVDTVIEKDDEENVSIPVTESLKSVISISAPENNIPSVPAQETVPVLPASVSPSSVSADPARKNPASSNTAPSAVSIVPVTSTQRPTQNTGTIVFVIDDAGNNLHELDPFLRIPGPLTIAVLPGLPYSAEAARRIRAAGKEVILHQPMEAIGAQNPGPGAIYSGMGEEEIRSILTRNIAEIGPVAGINNHQGSKISMDREIVEIILTFCSERGLFFLDSRTTAETVIPSLARRLGMKIAERDVFLDNEQDRDSMLRYISSGLTRAQRNGSAVMIGHVWSPALAPLLAEQYPVLTIQGYTLKTVSDIIK